MEFFNIRVVKAKTNKQAIENLMNEKFHESHDLMDQVLTANELRDALFPNGFICFLETHYMIVEAMTNRINDGTLEREDGIGGLWEKAESLAFKFEEQNKDRQWDGEFFDVIDEFLQIELNK